MLRNQPEFGDEGTGGRGGNAGKGGTGGRGRALGGIPWMLATFNWTHCRSFDY